MKLLSASSVFCGLTLTATILAVALPNLADSNSFKRSSISKTKPPKCFENIETSMCRAMIQRYTYNVATDSCEQFIYGGCGGSENNFSTKKLCEEACLNENYQVPNLPEAELSDVIAQSVLNNVEKNGRPHGNRNWNKNGGEMGLGMNFGFASDLSIPLSKTEEGKSNPCDDSPITEPGSCKALIRTFTYVKDSNKCVPAALGGCAMGTTNRFRSMENCEKKCTNGNFLFEVPTSNNSINNQNNNNKPSKNSLACSERMVDLGICRGMIPVYSFNMSTGKCEMRIYGGCNAGTNNFFNSISECRDECEDSNSIRETSRLS